MLLNKNIFRTFVIIILIFHVTRNIFPLDLRELNGYNWLNWSDDRKVGFVQGALVEGFTLTQLGLEYDIILDIDKFLSFRIDSVTIDLEIVNEITMFYQSTQRFEYPLYVVIHIRNSWKNQIVFPPWEEFQLRGWK